MSLRDELNKLFPGLSIDVQDEPTTCVNNADVIVTATNSSTALFGIHDLKKTSFHINGKMHEKESPELLIIIA